MNNTICPLDSRYHEKTEDVRKYFNDDEYIFMRLMLEEKYLLFLATFLPELANFKDLPCIITQENKQELVAKAKEYEKTTNHDVMAIMKTITDLYKNNGRENAVSFIHFALTSNDINSLAYGNLMKNFIENIYISKIQDISLKIYEFANRTRAVTMLGFTHGQPATPTTFGNQMMVFKERLDIEINILIHMTFSVKFGGATGGMNAHYFAYPTIDWKKN